MKLDIVLHREHISLDQPVDWGRCGGVGGEQSENEGDLEKSLNWQGNFGVICVLETGQIAQLIEKKRIDKEGRDVGEEACGAISISIFFMGYPFRLNIHLTGDGEQPSKEESTSHETDLGYGDLRASLRSGS